MDNRKCKDNGKGKNKSKDNGKDNSNEHLGSCMAEIIDGMVLLAQALIPLAKATVPPVLAPAPKTRGFPLTLPAAPRCEISVGNLQLLQASLARAYFAAHTGHNLLQQMAQQMDTEARVISQANDVVARILGSII